MTPVTALELEFADGQYLFDLKLPQLMELEEKCGVGTLAIYGRVLKGRYILGDETFGAPAEGEARVIDLFETIRLGLIGGGAGMVNGEEVKVSVLKAKTLVERYCHAAPLRESWTLAAAILGARVEGYSPPKKAEPADEPATPTNGSTSPASSPTAPPSEQTGEN